MRQVIGWSMLFVAWAVLWIYSYITYEYPIPQWADLPAYMTLVLVEFLLVTLGGFLISEKSGEDT